MQRIHVMFRSAVLIGAIASIGWLQDVDDASAASEMPLKIGAGGWLVGLDINPDGTRLVRTDTYGAYIWDANTHAWSQLVTQSRMPAANFGYVPRVGVSQVNQNGLGGNGGGVYEICSAPSNSSVIYMMANGWIFRSTDRGATFSRTSFGRGLPIPMNSNGPYRMNGRKMAVDPVNPLIVYAGSDTLGLFVTHDGGKNWIRVTDVATATGVTNYNIAFDPASALINGTTSVIYVFASNAVYVSTDAGATWTATKDGPKSVQHLVVAPTGGTVWATDGLSSGGLWKYDSGTWENVLPSGASLHSVAVDPLNSMHVVAGGTGGSLFVSFNGRSFSPSANSQRTSTDIPWLANTNENYMSNGDMIFDPSLPNTLVFAEGIGVWTTIPPASGVVKWTSISAGIEQLISRVVIAPNGIPIVGVSDRGTFTLSSKDIYPHHSNTTFYDSFSLNVTWGLDYAGSNTSFIGAVTGTIYSATNNNSGFSTDGGQTFRPFNSYYQDVPASSLVGSTGWGRSGLIRFTVPTTSNLTTWSAGAGSIVRVVSYGGASNKIRQYWPVTVVDETHFDLQGSNFATCECAGSGRYYVYVDTNPLSDNNGAFAVTGTSSDGGLINIHVRGPIGGGMANGLIACPTGVGGTSEANGCWMTTNTDIKANRFSLAKSTFSHPWTDGGTVNKTIPGGGGIGISTPLNFAMVGGNDDYPHCTTDGGKTWTQIRLPNGVAANGHTGWTAGPNINRRNIAADRVLPNTIYLFNVIETGNKYVIYTLTNCKVTSAVSGTIGNTAYSTSMIAVPGYARHMLVAVGPQGSAGSSHPAGGALRWSNDAGSSFISITNTNEPRAIGLGAIAPGSDYPTVYMVGWVDNVYGIWRATVTAAHWATNNVSWKRVGDYPLGSMDGVLAISGDLTKWNTWYLGWNGSGFAYGQQNFLLKRDLDPASNDNEPMFLNRAA